jgi:hypothetical protein
MPQRVISEQQARFSGHKSVIVAVHGLKKN